ncbi:MAG: serine hydrolase domain-containing protein [Chitinophagales bacterium]
MPRSIIQRLLTIFFIISRIGLFAQVADQLPRSNPEAEWVSSSDIIRFLDTLAKTNNEFHSIMILRHGKVIAEGWWNPYRPDLRHMMYSTSKSFTSTAVGFAVSEGRIKLSDKLVSFFPSILPDTVNTKLANLTLRDVITMSDGQRPDPTGAAMATPNWAQFFLSRPIPDTPGVNFLYNSLGTYMLSAVVQKVTGQTILDYLRPRLFEPLGIAGMDWETSPQGIDAGGWGLRVKTEDMAKFGKLYLQKGAWNGKQILSSAWIEEATSYKINNAEPNSTPEVREASDWAQGYCYQFWRCRHNAYRADGAFGQYIIVLPDQDAVIAITSESISMQNELNLIWTFLLPAFKSEKLPVDSSAYNLLRGKLAGLKLMPPVAMDNPLTETAVSGKIFTLDSNERKFDRISFQFKKKVCQVKIRNDGKDYVMDCAEGSWHLGETNLPGATPSIIRAPNGPHADLGPAKYAGAYTWKDQNTLELTFRYIESPHTQFLVCHFDHGLLSMEFDGSVQRMAHRKNQLIKGVPLN